MKLLLKTGTGLDKRKAHLHFQMQAVMCMLEWSYDLDEEEGNAPFQRAHRGRPRDAPLVL